MDFKLVCLGSSAASPVPGRWASAQWFKLGNTGFLCDCAEGTQIALQQVGIGWSDIDYILISHLHGDHIYGLPGLLTSWGLNQRKRSLTIIGPAGLEAWITHTLDLSFASLPFIINWEVSDPASAPQHLVESKDWTLSSLPLLHRIPSQGYILCEKPRQPNMNSEAIQRYAIPYQQIPAIKAGGDFVTPEGARIPHSELTRPPVPPRSFAYCSDTAYNPKLIPLLEGVDILYHEATFLHEMLEQAEYTGHTTCRQAAELAQAAEVGQLIIGHFSSRYGDLNKLLVEARTVFPETYLAELGKVFSVDFPGRG